MHFRAIYYEIQALLLAVSFLTRLPISQWLEYNEISAQKTYRYIPLVGLFIGALLALIFNFAASLFSIDIAIVLSLLFGFFLTGGLHEDGLADAADGLFGGASRAKTLSIMKDSSIGVYGVLALISTILLKVLLLAGMNVLDVTLSLVLAHGLSRWFMVSYFMDMEDARSSASESPVHRKTQSVVSKASFGGLLIAFVPIFPLLAFYSLPRLLALMLVLIMFRFIYGRYLRYKLGGFSGDCLGASQQVFEVLIYVIVAMQLI